MLLLTALALGLCVFDLPGPALGQQNQEPEDQMIAPADGVESPGDQPAADVWQSDSSPEDGSAAGYLQGVVDIGPLQPVERVGVPPPTPPPAACTARGLVVLTPDGQTEVTRVPIQPDCTYQVALAAGTYRVQLLARGIDRSRDLPAMVTITSGQATQLNVSIDTGIR